MSTDAQLLQSIDGLLRTKGATDDALLAVLDLVLRRFECVTGTIHDLNRASGLLELRAQRGIPAVILDKVSRIPIGKGMAGLAAERKEPVQVCNLQTDNSGVAKPGARDTKMEGSIASPMLVDRTVLRGVLGVAKPVAYEFTAAEQALLLQLGEVIGRHLGTATKQAVLDQYFIEVRAKLIEVAAFLDRVDRAEGEDDYRVKAFRQALKALEASEPERAKQILLALSDPTSEPIPAAKGKSAAGAWPGN
jgi:L-methionine (R)-S-oxide reductase